MGWISEQRGVERLSQKLSQESKRIKVVKALENALNESMK
jgi:hypothetical protein